MAHIVRAEIVGIRTAENGAGGVTINSTNYSVLLFYNDGSCSLVEGDSARIREYLKYMCPSPDFEQVKQFVYDEEKRMIAELKSLVKAEAINVFEALHKLPDVIGMSEDVAIQQLEARGFTVEKAIAYPPNTPPGVIIGCIRKNDAYMTAIIRVQHELPNVVGMPCDEAKELLLEKGFVPTIIEERNIDVPAQKVLRVLRESEFTMNVTLTISKESPLLQEGMPEEVITESLSKYGINIKSKVFQYSDSIEAGNLIKAEFHDANNISLIFSKGKNDYRIDNLSILISEMSDGKSGHATGSVVFKRNENILEFDLHIELDLAHKHTFTEEQECMIDGKLCHIEYERGYSVVAKSIESGEDFHLKYRINTDYKGDNPVFPSSMSLTLHTAYGGLVKKNDTIALSCSLNWRN